MKIFFTLIMSLVANLALAGDQGHLAATDKPGSTNSAGTVGSGTTAGSGAMAPSAGAVDEQGVMPDAGIHDDKENVSGRDTATPGPEGSTPSGMDATRPSTSDMRTDRDDTPDAMPSPVERTTPASTDRTTTTNTTGNPQPFGSVDSDGDGKVSMSEGSLLQNTGHSFTEGDSDKDGFLSASEYNRLVGSRTP